LVSSKQLIEYNPVEVAEYAVANMISSEPAFEWWVPYTLKKNYRRINAVNTRYLKRVYTARIEIPKSVKYSHESDRQTNTTYWDASIDL
jgi:hypothetical protein